MEAPLTVASLNLSLVSKVLIPTAEGFKDYPADHFEHGVDTATGVDEEKDPLGVEEDMAERAKRTSSPLSAGPLLF